MRLQKVYHMGIPVDDLDAQRGCASQRGGAR